MQAKRYRHWSKSALVLLLFFYSGVIFSCRIRTVFFICCHTVCAALKALFWCNLFGSIFHIRLSHSKKLLSCSAVLFVSYYPNLQLTLLFYLLLAVFCCLLYYYLLFYLLLAVFCCLLYYSLLFYLALAVYCCLQRILFPIVLSSAGCVLLSSTVYYSLLFYLVLAMFCCLLYYSLLFYLVLAVFCCLPHPHTNKVKSSIFILLTLF